MPAKIQFTIGIGLKAPISEGIYDVGDTKIEVSYPATVDLGLGPQALPNGLSTVFVVTWSDPNNKDSNSLAGSTHHRGLVVHKALDGINQIFQAYKLVRVGHYDGGGIRTIGINDTLFYYSSVDGKLVGDLIVGWKALPDLPHDPFGTTELAKGHIGAATLPVARRFLRCYELLEHGFYSESFIIAFSALDDLVQMMLQRHLEMRGMVKQEDRDSLLRGIKESRLKLYLGPVLTLVAGKSIADLWQSSEKTLGWINKIRNNIAHGGYVANYSTAAVGIYGCIQLLRVLHDAQLMEAEFPVEFFRHAKLTASWTNDPPDWVPNGAVAESMDYAS